MLMPNEQLDITPLKEGGGQWRCIDCGYVMDDDEMQIGDDGTSPSCIRCFSENVEYLG
jgi:hypothetical protein